jgi:cytochrome c oxidase cbb3-type subunit IV
MLLHVVHAIDYSVFAVVALSLFCIAFVLMIYAVAKLLPSSTKRFASIALSDHVEDPRDE